MEMDFRRWHFVPRSGVGRNDGASQEASTLMKEGALPSRTPTSSRNLWSAREDSLRRRTTI
jgi:hypothetical protein